MRTLAAVASLRNALLNVMGPKQEQAVTTAVLGFHTNIMARVKDESDEAIRLGVHIVTDGDDAFFAGVVADYDKRA
jgi:hypothetical protein